MLREESAKPPANAACPDRSGGRSLPQSRAMRPRNPPVSWELCAHGVQRWPASTACPPTSSSTTRRWKASRRRGRAPTLNCAPSPDRRQEARTLRRCADRAGESGARCNLHLSQEFEISPHNSVVWFCSEQCFECVNFASELLFRSYEGQRCRSGRIFEHGICKETVRVEASVKCHRDQSRTQALETLFFIMVRSRSLRHAKMQLKSNAIHPAED